MIRAIVLFAFLLSLTIFISCNKNSTEPILENDNTLLPLAVGNVWYYKLYTNASDSIGNITWTVTDTVSIDGKKYHLINTVGFGNYYYAVRNETNGLSLSKFDSTNGFTSPFFFKYPANDNETYQYQIPDSDSILNMRVKKETITINGINFNCYGYINENRNPYLPFMFYAENIGLIRAKLFFATTHSVDTSQYFAYDLQNKLLNK